MKNERTPSYKKIFNMPNNQRHPFHLVDPSPWPLLASVCAFGMTSGTVMYMHHYFMGGLIATISLLSLTLTAGLWWRDVTREGTFEGQHTFVTQKGLRMGMLLFILSEVMFFFAFFWAFFSSSLAPVPEIGCVWPPEQIIPLNPWEVPLLNTLILLTSGATCTWAHHAIVSGFRRQTLLSMFLTISLAALFTAFQVVEYFGADFSIADGIYGSTFYMATGFHGFHVFVGTCFLSVCTYRIYKHHFTREHHFGFEAAAWYWHFVDVVWLFLFITIYWWGSN
jgi:heme/copper-type cytochrome/quinol oxidase subunit 3